MLLQIALVFECRDTFFTGESLYSCVGPLVYRQGIFLEKSLVTFRASIWLLSCVGQASNLQATFLVKCFVTLGAGKWLKSCVG